MYRYTIMQKIFFSCVGNFYTRDVSLRLILTQLIWNKFKLWILRIVHGGVVEDPVLLGYDAGLFIT
jgi:hypothetical protein